jgi:hypothetical protein
MNDLSSTVGLMRRELRDAHAVLSRLDHQTRKLFEPARRKQKKAAEGPLHLDGSSIWLRPGPVSQGVPPLPCLRPYREIIGSLSAQGCSAGHTVDTKEPPEQFAVHPPHLAPPTEPRIPWLAAYGLALPVGPIKLVLLLFYRKPRQQGRNIASNSRLFPFSSLAVPSLGWAQRKAEALPLLWAIDTCIRT